MSSIIECVSIVLFVFLAILIINLFIINAKIPTSSMEPTIMKNNLLVASKMAYDNTLPERGDVVVFRHPNNKDILLVKRIIGLPGDTICISSGTIYINEIEYIEDHLKEPTHGEWGEYSVPDNSYFVLGDNRNNSEDSRYWGYVSEINILGKIIFRYYPNFTIFK